MTPKVPTNDSGTATLGMMVAAIVRKNKKMTNTTNAMVSINSHCTSLTDARIVVVRSVKTVKSTDGGRVALNWGKRWLMRSTTWMMFAPGWRWILTMMAGVLFI